MRFLFAALILAGLVGCNGGSTAATGAPPGGPKPVVVFAATSLREAFGVLAPAFQALHPELIVQFAFAGSQALRLQLEQGAPSDVFAAADEAQTTPLWATGRLEPPVVFAENDLVLVVSAERRASLTKFEDLPTASRIVLGADEVPVGRYTTEALDRMGTTYRAQVEARVVSRELNVRQVLSKVRMGEADAGVVYRTDALAVSSAEDAPPASALGVIELPPGIGRRARYAVARVTAGPNPAGGAAWIAFVRGPEGRAALAAAGFGLPAP